VPNDNPYVEQKNSSMVRRLVGQSRHDTTRQVQQLNALYGLYRLHVNHFLPVKKLERKERRGNRVKHVYDPPKRPYQRVLDSPHVNVGQKAALRAIHAKRMAGSLF
jgi:hypothetical protein